MRLGVVLPQMGGGSSPHVIDAFIDKAEAVGFDSLWTQEHLYRPLEPVSPYGAVPGTPWPLEHRRLLADFELLSYAAARTRRCTVGTSIAVVGYHHPVQLAKRAATIDVLSRGRMVLGLGVGWCRDEYALLGAPFERRGELADEFLEVLLACWGPDPVGFSGEHFRLPPAETSPKPFTGDRVRLLGGFLSPAGELRAARFCDVWQPYALDAEEARRRCDVINDVAAQRFGRGPLELSLRITLSPEIPGVLGDGRTSTPGRWAGDIDRLADHVRSAVTARCDEVVLDTSFAPGGGTEEAWLVQPEFLAPLVDIAHAGPEGS